MKQENEFKDSFEYQYYLQDEILKNSENKNFSEAINEWEIIEAYTNPRKKDSFLYKILNTETGATLSPVSAKTIHRWGNKKSIKDIHIFETLYYLKNKQDAGEDIEYKDINRDILDWFYYNEDLLEDNEYNGNNKENDYRFILQIIMQEQEPTYKQLYKFQMIFQTCIQQYIESLNIIESTKPYVKEKEPKQQQ